jgi:ABC-2 type transport system permease protein
LLAKPVGRPQILSSKFLAALTALAATDLVVWVSSYILLNVYRAGKTYDLKSLFLLLASLIIFQLFFLAVGVFISLIVRRVRSVTPFSMALAFGMYVLSAFGDMLGGASLEVISPFKHFEPNFIIRNGAYDFPLMMISVIVTVVSILGSYWLYSRRNIASAV